MEILLVIGVVILGIAVAFCVKAAIIYGIVWGLKAIGIATIFGWTVQFSWPLVIVVILITAILKSFISATVNSKN